MFQGHLHDFRGSNPPYMTYAPNNTTVWYPSGNSVSAVGTPISDGVNGAPRYGNRTQPRTLRMRHYMRIL